MEIAIIAILILLNGVFSMSEISLVSARKFRLESAAKKGNSNARKALELANNPNRFLSTMQIGITLIGILTGIFSGEEFTGKLEVLILDVPFLAPYAHSISVLVVVMIVTYLSIVFGELLPKRIGLLFPETIASFMAAPMNVLSKIAAPFIWLLTVTNNFFLRLFGIKNDINDRVTEEEIKAIVQQGADFGEIQEIEHSIVDRVFALGDRKIAELMTHRTDIVWFEKNDTLATVLQKVNVELHSVYPVASVSLDNIIGVVNVKEIFAANMLADGFLLESFIKKPLIVHENTAAYMVLERFRQTRQHHAIVVDEYGSVQGIISMDDILDALVGDVSEHDQLEYNIVKRDDNSWLVDGQFPYFELINYFDMHDYSQDDDERDFNTIAGLILHKAGRIPAIGEKIQWREFELEVVDMDGLRIDKILMIKNS
jgi:putative hemolysin